MSAAVQGIIVNGTSATLVDIECRLSNNLPTMVIVGLANRAVGESRERIRGAFGTSHIMLPRKRITVNLAPADVPKADSGFDMAMAVAIMLADGSIPPPAASEGSGGRGVKAGGSRKPIFIGELGLDGSVRAVRGIIGKVLAGRRAGVSVFFIPTANLGQARLVPGVRLVAVDDLARLYRYLSGAENYEPLDTGDGARNPAESLPEDIDIAEGAIRLSEIAGQAQAKRALEIAAAGGHNIFFDGPPGTGKSMLAKALPGLLPPLEREEMLEVTHLHSLAGQDYGRIITRRPFRAPHHGVSLAAVTGGGLNLRPGEISLAHRGVLLFDELPEFRREALEALRQPLEDRAIRITRAHGTAEYPADFIFVATANPCPCGYAGNAAGADMGPEAGSKACRCQPGHISSYRNRLSGPVMDRIDLYSRVHEVEHGALLERSPDPAADEAVRRRIVRTRARQAGRRGKARLNADMTNDEVRKSAGTMTSEARNILDAAARRLGLSARAYMRAVKVARTIADLEESDILDSTHLSEALSYRPAADVDL